MKNLENCIKNKIKNRSSDRLKDRKEDKVQTSVPEIERWKEQTERAWQAQRYAPSSGRQLQPEASQVKL